MADRRNISSGGEFGFFEGGTSPFQKAMQSHLSRTPEAFSYSELDQKYPTQQVMPIMPTHIRRELNEDILAEKEREVALKVRQAQLNNYESKLNNEAATAEQVQLARQRFAKLNPQDPDYQNKRDQIFIDLPHAEFNDDFRNGTVARLDRVNDRYMSKLKLQTPESAREMFSKGMNEKIKVNQLLKEGEISQGDANEYIKILDKQIGEAKSQLGMPDISSDQKPELAPPAGVKEGKVYRQGGKNYKYTNGQFVELP